MDHSSLEHLQGLVDDSRKNDVSDTVQPKLHKGDDSNQHQSNEKGNQKTTEVETKKKSSIRKEVTDAPGDINMEASISPDDVMRAGGFGARDDLSSFLPAASDSTDFEESLLDAREYEEQQEEIKRPGLGWTDAKR